MPIGRKYAFTGTFEGNGYIIKNMTCYMSSSTDSYYSNSADSSSAYGAALFGTLTGATIENFAMTGVSITTANSISVSNSYYYKFAAIAAIAQSSADIDSINLFGSIKVYPSGTPKEFCMGSAVGYVTGSDTYVKNITSYMELYSGSSISYSVEYCGGLVGYLTGGYVEYSAFLGYIDFYGAAAGGLVGFMNGADSKLYASYVVRGSNYTSTSTANRFWLGRLYGGGLVGVLGSGTVKSCWASVGVINNSTSSSTQYLGALFGFTTGAKIYCNAYNSSLYGCSTAIGFSLGTNTTSGESSGCYAFSSYTAFHRSSSFHSYMTYNSNGITWSGSWKFNTSTYNHLNYGFPVNEDSYVPMSTYASHNTKTVTMYATGTGVDTSYTSGGNKDGATSCYALLGGAASITVTGNSNCYYRGVYKYVYSSHADYSQNVINSNGSSTSTTTSVYYANVSGGGYLSSFSFRCRLIVTCAAATTDYWENNYASSFAGGSGTTSSPYLISTAAQLARLAYLSNSSSSYNSYNGTGIHYKLTTDINLAGKYWTPIGLKYAFYGEFDGNGYTINGMTCKLFSHDDSRYLSDSTMYMGLFGRCYEGTNIHHFVLSNVSISYVDLDITGPTVPLYVGGVCAFAGGDNETGELATFDKVGVYGELSLRVGAWNTYVRVGGVIGHSGYYVSVTQSFNSAYLFVQKQYYKGSTLYEHVGGIIAFATGGNITVDNCYNNGLIRGTTYMSGGIVGYGSGVSIRRSYTSANVAGNNIVGGILAWGSSCYVYNSFVDGTISVLQYPLKIGGGSRPDNSTNYGALVGSNSSVTASYFGYNSGNNSKTCGAGSPTMSNTYSYTSSTTSRPNNSNTWSVFRYGTYTWSRTTTIKPYTSGNTTTPADTWTLPINYSYINDRFPVLSWTMRYRTMYTTFHQCGNTYIKLTDYGASDTRTTATATYCLLGMNIKLNSVATSGFLGTYQGMREYYGDAKYDILTTSTSITHYIKGSTYVGSNGYSYYGVYNGAEVGLNAHVLYYTPYDESVTVGSTGVSSRGATVGATYYTTGDPFDYTTTTASTGTTAHMNVATYLYKTTTFTTACSNSYWKFLGWYLANPAPTASTLSSATYDYESMSYSYTPTIPAGPNFYAVYTPYTTDLCFAGSYYSLDGGNTYSRTTSLTSKMTYVKPTYSDIINDTRTTVTNTSSDQSISRGVWTYWALSAKQNANYTFEGWYYSTNPVTSSNIASANLITTNAEFTYNGTSPGGYIFAKYTRKSSTLTVQIVTDGEHKNGGVTPTISYTSYGTAATEYTFGGEISTALTVQSGTTIILQNPGIVGKGYALQGYTYSPTSGIPSMDVAALNTLSETAQSSDYYLTLFYTSTSANKLKYASKNSAIYSAVNVDMYVNGYGFKLNANGFYESQNFGVANSFALARVTFTLENDADVVFQAINYAESNYDCGMFSELDKTLSASNAIDSTIQFVVYNSPYVQTVVYENVSAGEEHCVYIKYRKDASVDAYFDSLQFKLVQELSDHSYYYFESGVYPQSYVGDEKNVELFNSSLQGNLQEICELGYTDSAKTWYPALIVKDEDEKYYAALTPKLNATIDGITFYAGATYYFNVEPIRWRVGDYDDNSFPAKFDKYGTIMTGFDVVSDKVLAVSLVDARNTSENYKFIASYLFQDTRDNAIMFNEYKIDTESYIGSNENAVNYQYGPEGQQIVVVKDTYKGGPNLYSGIRVASLDEIQTYMTDIRAEYTDFAKLMLCDVKGIETYDEVYGQYWTRNLGTSLDNGVVVTKLGRTKNCWLDQVWGVRYSATLVEGSNLFYSTTTT